MGWLLTSNLAVWLGLWRSIRSCSVALSKSSGSQNGSALRISTTRLQFQTIHHSSTRRTIVMAFVQTSALHVGTTGKPFQVLGGLLANWMSERFSCMTVRSYLSETLAPRARWDLGISS